MRNHGLTVVSLLLIGCGGGALPPAGSTGGTSSSALVFNPVVADFGKHAMHLPAPPISIALTNDRPQSSRITSLVMAGADVADFRLDTLGMPFPFALAPGALVTYSVSFTASKVGVETAELRAYGLDPAEAIAVLSLSGTGL